MSTFKEAKVLNNGVRMVIECFSSAQEVADVSNTRTITDSLFDDLHNDRNIGKGCSGAGVRTFADAQNLLRTGYQPTVDRMKTGIKANVQGQGKRISFKNDVVGYQPIVPLAIQGVPNCMVNSYMKPIKNKVLNIYYDMTCSAGTTSDEIIEAGQKVLAAIMELEMQGYKFNLYAVQTYFDGRRSGGSCYTLCTKIKSANTPMDLKRISFPLTHTAYFRVIGWDWYSRCPKAKYISCYGHALGYDYSADEISKAFEQIMKEKCVYFSAAKIRKEDTESIKEVLQSRG